METLRSTLDSGKSTDPGCWSRVPPTSPPLPFSFCSHPHPFSPYSVIHMSGCSGHLLRGFWATMVACTEPSPGVAD
eukprot:scaffold25666_cov101-Isochrysis_galbana.AAC.1